MQFLTYICIKNQDKTSSWSHLYSYAVLTGHRVPWLIGSDHTALKLPLELLSEE